MSDPDSKNRTDKSDQEWKSKLTDEQFRVTRESGTEAPFSHEYNDNKADGTYNCICCGEPLFNAQAKYDSGSGWPSFYQPDNEDGIDEHKDTSLFNTRTEVTCAKCQAHLGHVFPDGPQPTGLRYCINGQALSFTPEQIDKGEKS